MYQLSRYKSVFTHRNSDNITENFQFTLETVFDPYLRNKNCVTEKEETLLGKLLSISLIIILVLCFFLLFHFDIHYIFRFVSGDTFFYL